MLNCASNDLENGSTRGHLPSTGQMIESAIPLQFFFHGSFAVGTRQHLLREFNILTVYMDHMVQRMVCSIKHIENGTMQLDNSSQVTSMPN